MPIYEYQCAKCGHQCEVLQKVSDEPLRRCMACGEDSLDKLISATNFQLKGSGWYKAAPSESGASSVTKKSDEGTAADSANSPAGNSPPNDSAATAAKAASTPNTSTAKPKKEE
jgi:putative FmdB family regulatory protein